MKNNEVKELLKNGLKSNVPDTWSNIMNAKADVGVNSIETDCEIGELVNDTKSSYIFPGRYKNIVKYAAATLFVVIISCVVIFSNIFDVNMPVNSTSPDASPETAVSETQTNAELTPSSSMTPTPTPFTSPTSLETPEIPKSNVSISAIEEPSVSAEIPEVITYFELFEEEIIDGHLKSGFDVKLPKILSEKPGAISINNEIDKIKEDIESKYNAVEDLKTYDAHYKYSYEALNFGNMLFINIRYTNTYLYSEYDSYTRNFAYDFISDKILTNQDIAMLFNVDLDKITEKINYILYINSDGFEIPSVRNSDDYYLYINLNGQLMADAIAYTYVPAVEIINLVKGSYITEVIHYVDLTHDGTAEKILLDLNNISDLKATIEVYKINDGKEELIWKESIRYDEDEKPVGLYLYEKDGLNYIVKWFLFGNNYDNYFYCEVFSLSPSGEEILLKQEAFILDEATDDDDIVSYYKKIEPYVIHSYVFIDQFIDGTIMFSTSAHPMYSNKFCGEGMCLFKFNNKLER